MAFDATQKFATLKRWQETNSDSIAFTKNQLSTAFDNVDAWLDANATEYNQALPVAIRNGATLKQKLAILLHVIKTKYEV